MRLRDGEAGLTRTRMSAMTARPGGAPRPERTSGGADHGPFLLAFYLFFLLGVVIPLWLVWKNSDAGAASMLPAALAWAVVLYCSIRLAWMAFRGAPRILGLTFWMFSYAWLGIAPLAQFTSGEFPYGGLYSDGTVAMAFILVFIGFLGYECGSRLRRGPPGLDRVGAILRNRRVDLTRSLAVSVVAITGSVIIILLLGGVEVFLASRRDVYLTLESSVATEYRERLHIVSKLLVVPPFIALYLLWGQWLKRRHQFSTHFKAFFWMLLLLNGAITALVSNPVNSARYWFGTIVLSLLFITMSWHRRLSFASWTVVLTIMLLVVFPYADVFRVEVNLDRFHFTGLEPLVKKGDYDAFQQLMNGIVHVQQNGHTHGQQMLGAALFWVPRRFWPGKPLSSGEMVAETMGYSHVNLAMPLWGEAYLDAGVPLVFFVFLLYGALVGAVERVWLDTRVWRTLGRFLAPIVAAYQFLLLRGALMSAIAYLAPIIVLLALATRASPPPARPAEARPVPARRLDVLHATDAPDR